MSSTGDRQTLENNLFLSQEFLSLVQELIIGPVQINSIPVSLVPV